MIKFEVVLDLDEAAAILNRADVKMTDVAAANDAHIIKDIAYFHSWYGKPRTWGDIDRHKFKNGPKFQAIRDHLASRQGLLSP